MLPINRREIEVDVGEFGFEFVDVSYTMKHKIRDEKGKIIYQLEPAVRTIPHITVNTLEELMDLSVKVGNGNSLIISPDSQKIFNGVDWVSTGSSIEIYDGYRE